MHNHNNTEFQFFFNCSRNVLLVFSSEYLLRIPNLKVLRVYSDQIEQKEFPNPNKLKPPRATRSDEELKISSDKIRHVSLHHVIRGPECRYSQELRQFEEGFAQSKAKGEMISQKEVTEYSKVSETVKSEMTMQISLNLRDYRKKFKEKRTGKAEVAWIDLNIYWVKGKGWLKEVYAVDFFDLVAHHSSSMD